VRELHSLAHLPDMRTGRNLAKCLLTFYSETGLLRLLLEFTTHARHSADAYLECLGNVPAFRRLVAEKLRTPELLCAVQSIFQTATAATATSASAAMDLTNAPSQLSPHLSALALGMRTDGKMHRCTQSTGDDSTVTTEREVSASSLVIIFSLPLLHLRAMSEQLCALATLDAQQSGQQQSAEVAELRAVVQKVRQIVDALQAAQTDQVHAQFTEFLRRFPGHDGLLTTSRRLLLSGEYCASESHLQSGLDRHAFYLFDDLLVLGVPSTGVVQHTFPLESVFISYEPGRSSFHVFADGGPASCFFYCGDVTQARTWSEQISAAITAHLAKDSLYAQQRQQTALDMALRSLKTVTSEEEQHERHRGGNSRLTGNDGDLRRLTTLLERVTSQLDSEVMHTKRKRASGHRPLFRVSFVFDENRNQDDVDHSTASRHGPPGRTTNAPTVDVGLGRDGRVV
jgi:hypothetical protein